MATEDISGLLQRYLTGSLTATEQQRLMKALSLCSEAELEAFLQQQWEQWAHPGSQPLSAVARQNLQTILGNTVHETIETPVHTVRHVHFLRKWGWAAACLIVLMGIGAYLWIPVKKNNQSSVAKVNAEIHPGKEGAILTLADGTQVVLDSLGNGIVATQNGSQAVLANGSLSYTTTGEISGGPLYNSMSTPKGRQFRMQLPDGTNAWLNAASSLRYPTVFSGNERNVEVTGEVYFEVAENAAKPFTVTAPHGVTIEVLGTHFNVNAYENENKIRTTLLEGAVRVSRGASGVVLKPGQQASVQEQLSVNNNINVDNVMAWKNGAFNFEGLSLEEAMRQLERWYDIKVEYEKDVPELHFFGKISRNVNLAELLDMLSGAKLRFRIEDGERLIIMK